MSGAFIHSDWEALFSRIAIQLKAFAVKHWPLEPDKSGSDFQMAVHKMFESFPFAAEVLLFDTAGIQSPQIEPIATGIRYDLSRPNTPTFKFHDIIPLVSIEDHAALVESVLDIEADCLDDLQRWPSVFGSDSTTVLHVVPYDPRTKPLEYAEELARELAERQDLIELFSPRIDFNAKYNVRPDPPLTDEALGRMDELSASLVKLSDRKPFSLSERHLHVASIQLIPKVPDSVKRTLDLAKKLYVYAHFEYGFFTISLHYALLALDAALHARWSATLPASVVLTYNDKKTRQTLTQTMDQPSHVGIRSFAKRAKWKVVKILVDGKPFPHTVKGVIAELYGYGLLTQWERKIIEDFYLEVRNNLTHLERAPVHMPWPDMLRQAAYLINKLFD